MAINITDLKDTLLENIREAENAAAMQEALVEALSAMPRDRDDIEYSAEIDAVTSALVLKAYQPKKRLFWSVFGMCDIVEGHAPVKTLVRQAWDGLTAKALQAPEHKPDPDRPAPISYPPIARVGEKAAADVLNRPLGETGVPTGLARTPTRQTLEKWVTRALELADDYAGANPKIRYIAEVNYHNISVLLQAYHVDDDIRANARGMALSSVDIAEHGLNAEITRAWDAITLEVYKVHEQSLKQDPTAGRGDARAQPQPNHASASQAVAAAPPVGALGAGGRLGGAGAGGGAIMGGGAIPSTQSGMAGLNDRERLIWQLGFNAGKGDSPPMPLSAVTSDLADRIADAIIALNNEKPRSPTRAEIIEAVAAALTTQAPDESGRGSL